MDAMDIAVLIGELVFCEVERIVNIQYGDLDNRYTVLVARTCNGKRFEITIDEIIAQYS